MIIITILKTYLWDKSKPLDSCIFTPSVLSNSYSIFLPSTFRKHSLVSSPKSGIHVPYACFQRAWSSPVEFWVHYIIIVILFVHRQLRWNDTEPGNLWLVSWCLPRPWDMDEFPEHGKFRKMTHGEMNEWMSSWEVGWISDEYWDNIQNTFTA